MKQAAPYTKAALTTALVGLTLFSAAALSAPPTCEGPRSMSMAAGSAMHGIQLAALDTQDGPAPCGKDGVCNLAVCSKDPDCPPGVGAQVNHPDTTETLKLNIEFDITKSAGRDSASRTAALSKIAAWIATAEMMYTQSPQLKISPSYRFDTIDVPTSFKNDNEVKRWLKDHYDNIEGDSKTEGKLVVAVTPTGIDLTYNPKNTCDDGGFGGLAFFPDSVKPFALKHGIVLSVTKADGSFAHELGHIFGLIHAFDRSSIFNKECNKDFPKSEGGTRDGSKINLMDHGLLNGDQLWLNQCQKDKAADHRKSLMTNDGKTNYGKL